MIKSILTGLAIAGTLSYGASAETLRVGLLKLSSSAPVFIAQEKGFFKEAGVDIELKYFEAAQPIAVAAVSGDIDIGVTAFTAGFYNLAGKGALKVIAAQAREEPGYALNGYLVTPKAYEAGLTSLDKLAGRKIGITQKGSSFHYSIGLLADKLKLDMAKMELVPLQSIPNMVSAFKGSQVDGILLTSSSAYPLIESGEAKLLGWVGDETPCQLNAVFGNSKYLADHRDAAKRFVAGYVKGAQLYYDTFLTKGPDGQVKKGPDYDALLAVVAQYTGQKPEQLTRGLPFIDPKGRLLVGDIYNQVAWYQKEGLVDKGTDAKSFIDLSFVEGHLGVPN